MKKIAELNSRFSEQQQRPLKSLGALLASLAGTAVVFRFFFYGRWADGKRWWSDQIDALGPWRAA